MKRIADTTRLILLFAASVLLWQPQARAEDEASWIFRLGASSTSISGDLEDNDTVETDSGEGLVGTAEIKLHPRLGIELGLMGSDQIGVRAGGSLITEDTTRAFALVDDLRYRAESAGVNFHLTPGKPLDLYVGVALGYFHYSNLNLDLDLAFALADDAVILNSLDLGTRIVVDDDLALGAVLGMDLSFGDSGWMLSAAVRAFDSSAEISNADGLTGEVEIDPVIAHVGVGFKF